MKLNPQALINSSKDYAKYIAMDSNFCWHIFSARPIIDLEINIAEKVFSGSGQWVVPVSAETYFPGCFDKHYIPLELDFDGDWKDSLFVKEGINNEKND